jgi:V/A-type H+-transporting ATPase subunit E
MTEDLQQLLEKIQRDGVDKAQTEADAILKKAKTDSAALINSAQAEADKLKSDAQQEAEAYAARAKESVTQSARDVLLQVEQSVTELLTILLQKDVNTALNSEEVVAALVEDAVKTYISGGESIEVAAVDKMATALRAKLAKEAVEGVTVVTDQTTGSGFRIKLADGRIEHDFTGAAVTAALSRQLRPGLAALLKS